jgi:dTDP-L-rhamnose 4-epimerase
VLRSGPPEMSERVLVTGGAGFIGSHLVDALLERGDRVRVLDHLCQEAHPGGPPRLRSEVEFLHGDLRDERMVDRSLEGVSVVFHLGGMVGNGQSMVELRRYVDVNAVGTATLLERALERRDAIRRLVVASSMVVYGDGAYACDEHGVAPVADRPLERLQQKRWEPPCPRCGADLQPIAIGEDRPLAPNSVYGISKRDQEELCLVVGRAYGLSTVALRYLCTYGSRQALGNPYTGVAAIWATRLLNGKRPIVFEDGRQLRDFVHVSDVVRATIAAADAGPGADFQALNVGSGAACTVTELAAALGRALGIEKEPELEGRFRVGDIRHCFADISRAKTLLGWSPRVELEDGIRELAEWAQGQRPEDRSDRANAELAERGVIRVATPIET